jgi:hypothetical protein
VQLLRPTCLFHRTLKSGCRIKDRQLGQTSVTPDEPPSMAQAVRMLAKKGGHLGRRGEGPPGTHVLWRGLQHLDVAVHMYHLFTHSPPPRSWRSYPEGYLARPQAP